jgi:hypothetical protein
VTTRDRDYQLMMGALADVTRRRNNALENAEQAYQDSTARAAGELARAEGEAVSADRWAGAAAAQVIDVDREAIRLWEQLRRSRGMRMYALGEAPEPAPVDAMAIEAMPRVALRRGPDAAAELPESARALLARAAERIDDAVRPAAHRALPRRILPLLPPVGALFAAGTGLLAAGLVTFGETSVPGGAVIRAVGWLTFLIAPSAGVPVAALVSHRRLQARLNVGGIGLTLLGGMVAATLLSVTFATAR